MDPGTTCASFGASGDREIGRTGDRRQASSLRTYVQKISGLRALRRRESGNQSQHVHLLGHLVIGKSGERVIGVRQVRYAHTCRQFLVCGCSSGASPGTRVNMCMFFSHEAGGLGGRGAPKEEAFTTCASFFARAWVRKPGEAHSLRTYVQRISGFAGQREGQSLA